MTGTGADIEAVQSFLRQVRETSWAAGRTFRRKHLVLLAFAEDAQPDGEDCTSCRLTRAVLAASKHTTGAHFVLVANGFTLDAMTRWSIDAALVGSGWRSFTAIEVPEFEGFSSAINRAMKVIPDNSLVAILSTSDLLLPSSTDFISPPTTLSLDGRNVADDASTDVDNEHTASDIFVGNRAKNGRRTRGSRSNLSSTFFIGSTAINAETTASAGIPETRSPDRKRVTAHRGTVLVSDGLVPHVHDSSWGERFVTPWPASGFQPRCPTPEEHERSNESVRSSGGGEQAFRSKGTPASEGIIFDQWTRLPPAKLEALAQADADLFFLPLVVLLADHADAPHGERPLKLCVAFHTEWMKRSPDRRMLETAVVRRKTSPVAMVVMAHDEISLLRPALEEMAVIVDHILVVVSVTSWHGDAMDVSPTLGLLDDMLEDVDSPTHGKLRVEVGSWNTEPEQREYGNAVIRDDPRKFWRVVAVDADEFWHPVELARALDLAADHPEARHLRAQVNPYWANVRSAAFPLEVLDAVWLIDPHHCIWREFREVLCDVEVDEQESLIDSSAGIIRHLSYHEERHNFELLQIRPVCGDLAIVDVSEGGSLDDPSWATARYTGKMDTSHFGSTLRGGDAVWSKLLEATQSRDQCATPPCGNGKRILAPWAELAEEMSRIQGAVIVRRTDLAETHGMFSPAENSKYVKTLQSYFGIFSRFLFPGRLMIAGHNLGEVRKNRRFIEAVHGEDSAAARFLSTTYFSDFDDDGTYFSDFDDDGRENIPTLVGMADVFVNKLGYVWNEKDYIVPASCEAELFGPRVSTSLPTTARSYDKVFVMAQRWGDEYFHFLAETLPRITLMLDILRKHVDIKIALYAPQPTSRDFKTYMVQFLELLGLRTERLIFIEEPIHANLAIMSSSAPCFKPDAGAINIIRHILLQALYPGSGGVPPPPARPVVVLVVRNSLRWLGNNEQVRDALQQEFPAYDVVEFFGVGPIVSQLELFATAALVVAPHGAGLSNIMVSPRHTPVLEIAPPACTACYVHLALKLQHIYARHPVSSSWTTPCESEYEPNVEEIIVLVRHLFEAKRRADAVERPVLPW
eukprot:g4210.t1